MNTRVNRMAQRQAVIGGFILASLAPSASAPSSTGGVTLEAIMAQLMHMDVQLDTLSEELCQVNTRAGRIA